MKPIFLISVFKSLAYSVIFLLNIYQCAAQPNQIDLYDGYGGITSIKGTTTGWFHVQELNGRWYFITPEGNAFFSLGATHAIETIDKDELNMFETRYDSNEEKLSHFFIECFKAWGYNSGGYGSLPTMEKMIPYVATIWTEGPRSHSAGEKSGFSDIFDPMVRERLSAQVTKIAGEHKNKKTCLGYVFIDLPVWGVIPQRGISYVDFYRKSNSGAPGKLRYLEFLREKYNGHCDSLNHKYGLSIRSLEELNSLDLSKITPQTNPQIAPDDEEFLAIIAESYYQCVVPAVKKSDPNHLILGDRLMAAKPSQSGLRLPDKVLLTAAKYCDVLSFQPMGYTNIESEYIDYVYSLTGKPILFADTNAMVSRPSEGQTDTREYEKASGEHTYNSYLDATQCKALIGIHRCTVRDYRPWDMNFHRRGLLKADDTPYPILVDYTKRANEKVYEMVYGIK